MILGGRFGLIAMPSIRTWLGAISNYFEEIGQDSPRFSLRRLTTERLAGGAALEQAGFEV